MSRDWTGEDAIDDLKDARDVAEALMRAAETIYNALNDMIIDHRDVDFVEGAGNGLADWASDCESLARDLQSRVR